MNTPIDLSTVVIDGMKLKHARESRALSVTELAALLTMSREQVQHIEDGGDRPFYTPAHKLLAIRKYAAAMGIPYDDVVSGPGATDTMPVPAAAPASLMVHGEGEEATDLRLAAVERNAEIRRFILIGLVMLMIVLAIYAKLRGTPDELPPRAPLGSNAVEVTQAPVATAAPVARSMPSPTLPAPASPAVAESTPASALIPAPASATVSTNVPTPAPASAAAAASLQASAVPAPARQTGGTPTAVADASTSANAGPRSTASGTDCAPSGSGELKTWTPPYPRKSDTRLFLVSPKASTICIVDAAGKATQLSLKARSGQAYSGKPPYVVQSPLLPELEIFLQGTRVRIPAQTQAIRLKPSTGTIALQ